MQLTRQQFEVLSAFASVEGTVEEKVKFDISGCLRELEAAGFVENGSITGKGLAALEPYRAKRAIFIAAGFGSRLVPITLNTPKPLVRVHGVRIIDRLIDACLEAGIEEIYIVRGYLGEQFDQLLYKYPMIKFIDNALYNQANNISSSLLARHLLCNAYVFEADLVISNPKIIQKYHYTSDFLAIKKPVSTDWCFRVKDGVIVEEKTSGEGEDIWQMVGISYWNEEAGLKLAKDIEEVYSGEEGKNFYWEQVPLFCRKENYSVEVLPCYDEDIVEIDSFAELKAIDKAYVVD